MPNVKNVYSGKMDLDKLINYHSREAWLGSARGQYERAKFHDAAVHLLEHIKDVTEQNEHTRS